MLFLQFLKQCRQNSPMFLRFVLGLFMVYLFQLISKTEITPLGYFSLYSNATPRMSSYPQILPSVGNGNLPLDIYQLPGTGFIAMEILPTRYQILKHADHCNQMNFKLQRLGFSDQNKCDCEKLKLFQSWFLKFAHRQGIELSPNYQLKEFGFYNGQLLNVKNVE